MGDKDSFAKCDPFEQKGMPMDLDTAKGLFTAVPLWEFSGTCVPPQSIERQFSFDSVEAMHEFMSKTGNWIRNNGHTPQRVSIDYETRVVKCLLRTPQLKGLSYNDFHMALTLDGIYDTLKP